MTRVTNKTEEVPKEGGERLSITLSDTKQRSRVWSITINNPSSQEIEDWKNATALHWVVEAKGQLEMGTEGTLHIQGYLKTQPVRFSQVKKAFPRAHIEVAKNPTALAQYVSKAETRVAPLEQTNNVVTPQRIQTSLTEYIIEEVLTRKGEPLQYSLNKKTWSSEVIDIENFYSADPDSRIKLIEKNEQYLEANSETIIDKVVNKLIREGFMTVEFIMSNNQVRTAYKKYFASICIRNVRQAQARNSSPPEETLNEEVSVSSPSYETLSDDYD